MRKPISDAGFKRIGQTMTKTEPLNVIFYMADGTDLQESIPDDTESLDAILREYGVLNSEEVEDQVWNHYEKEPINIDNHEIDPDMISEGYYPRHIIVEFPERKA